MHDQKLRQIVRLILTEASRQDLEVIQESIDRRRESMDPPGALPPGGAGEPRGSSPAKMAQEVATGIRRQVRQSMRQVHGMVREAVAGILRRDAPELSAEQVQALLEAWVPEKGGQSPPRSPPLPAVSPAGGERPSLPAPALLSMVRQFVAYSTGAMSSDEQAQLREAIPDWPRKYWQCFPASIRELVTSLLRERIGAEDFWQAVRIRLFEPPNPPSGSAP